MKRLIYAEEEAKGNICKVSGFIPDGFGALQKKPGSKQKQFETDEERCEPSIRIAGFKQD
jgi:hypothetical protein